MSGASNHIKDLEFMNAQSSMVQTARTMQTKRRKWRKIDWKVVGSYVNRL